jgi:hypothetical protein
MKSSRTRRERTSRRGRVPLPDAERKAKLIQTRVDGELDDLLRDAAKQRRVTVSQLIRNVLEDAFKVADGTATDAASPGTAVRRDGKRATAPVRARPRNPSVEEIDAWQDVVIARQAACETCMDLLNRGDKALMGVSDDPTAPKIWLCTKCAAKL